MSVYTWTYSINRFVTYKNGRKIVKITLNYNLNEEDIQSQYYKLLDDITPIEIPAEYIDYVEIHYLDESVLELKGDDLKYPIPVNKKVPKKEIQEFFKKMKEVRIFIKLSDLEQDINNQLDQLLKISVNKK